MTHLQHYLSENLEVPKESVTLCQESLKHIQVAKGTQLLQAGEICQYTYFVEKGLLRMFALDRNGKEHVIQFAPENWLISDRSSLYFNEKSKFYIDAVEDTEVLMLNSGFFTELSKLFPESADKIDLLLQKHIRNLQNRISSLLSETAEERYLNFLKMYPDIMQRVPLWMVASYLGITPESLSRVRKNLVKK
ncbi:MAG: Crp/Fnr family transcriptional regulator [Bacteroidetes bacterium]|nr:Crp/Fnr family transcriptional regulator [Bacteroidota bacterium]